MIHAGLNEGLGARVLDEVGQERGRRLRAFDQVICSASFSWKLFFPLSHMLPDVGLEKATQVSFSFLEIRKRNKDREDSIYGYLKR